MFSTPKHESNPLDSPPSVRQNASSVKLEPNENQKASVKEEFVLGDDSSMPAEESDSEPDENQKASVKEEFVLGVPAEESDSEPEEDSFFDKQYHHRAKRRRQESAPRTNSGLRCLHVHALGSLLDQLVSEHRLRDAAGVLSVLMLGSASFSAVTDEDHRRNHVVAMELNRRFRGRERKKYPDSVEKLYDEWTGKFPLTEKYSKKKNEVKTELALFYSTQGMMDDAVKPIKLVVEKCDLTSESSVSLLYGMISYQLWYSSLPEELKINGASSCKPFERSDNVSVESSQQPEISGSSYNHYAVDTKDPTYASESSVGNEKVFRDSKLDVPRRKSHYSAAANELHISHSRDTDEQKSSSFNLASNLQNTSVFFANGLDMSLLPIRLPRMTEDTWYCIDNYRKFKNDDYGEAVKHLKLALHSTPPVHAALLPLVQILLLGDQVEDALNVLESACDNLDTALPFRLKGRLLECFQSNKTSMICSCYENALRRDPFCNQSMERLIQLHKNGNCSTVLIFEMITLHLDAADGKYSIWEEYAMCFRSLLEATLIEYEDCTSINPHGGETIRIATNRIPRLFLEGNVRGAWKLRFEWWKRRHFNNSSLLKQSGDQKILCFKAACASHMYGPTHNYVLQVLKSLRERGDNDHLSILRSHMKNSMKLYENL